MKVPCHNVEIHVTHACNLACDGCSHFSNYGFGGKLSVEEFVGQVEPWANRLFPKKFSILGGEPAIHPDLVQIVRESRRLWPGCIVRLVTNGFLLHNHPDLPIALSELNIHLELSIHDDSQEYRDRLVPVLGLVQEWQDHTPFPLNIRESYKRWYRLFQGSGESLRPAASDPETAWKNCRCKGCWQIRESKLWKCPPVAYLPMVVDRLHLTVRRGGRGWNTDRWNRDARTMSC